MEKTTHYELNQWAGEDRIMRVDFNADNEKLDAALYQLSQAQTAQGAALDTERRNREAQDTAIRQEFAAGDTAARQAAAAEDAAIRQEMSQQAAAIRSELAAGDAAVEAANSLIRLARIVTEQDAAQVDVNISGYDLSKYAELILVPYVRSDASIIYVRVNNLSDNIYQNFRGDHSTVLTFFYDYDYGYVLPVRLTATNRLTCPSATFPTYVPSSFVPPDGDITLNLYGDGGQPLSAGSEIILYGVRK